MYYIAYSGHYYNHHLYKSKPGNGDTVEPPIEFVDNWLESRDYMSVPNVEVHHILDTLEDDMYHTHSSRVCRDIELRDRHWDVGSVSAPF